MLSYNLSPLPLSLANPDGSLAKTNKVKLMHLLEDKCEARAQWSIPSAHATYIIDAMAILQMQSRAPTTFGDLADVIFSVVTTSFSKGGNRVDSVVDQYHDKSIKAEERKRRAQQTVSRMQVTRSSQRCPQHWSNFLTDGTNKSQVIAFLAEEWTNPRYAAQLNWRSLYITV